MDQLKAELLKLSLKEICKESCSLVSSKHPSVLRSVNVSNMAVLSLEKICQELRDRAPLIYSFMMTIAVPRRSVKEQVQRLPSIAAAASILLKERSRFMNGFQLILTMIIRHTGFQVCLLSYSCADTEFVSWSKKNVCNKFATYSAKLHMLVL